MSHQLIALHEQAAHWLMRRSEPGWTGADERALNVWLDASPQHRQIYDGMALTSHDLHQIPLARDAAWRPQAAQAAPLRQAPAPASDVSRWSRRAWLSSAVAACAVLALGGGYGWRHWQNLPTYELDIATAQGERRTLDLPDGSSIALNMNSQLTVRYSAGRREVALQRGEAFFEVAKDAARPFTVDSGASQVKVVGTVLNVRAASPQMVVKVLQGRVEVRPDRAAPRPQVYVLNPGNGLSIDPASLRARNIAAIAETVGDWRSGQLHFKRTPLSEVASELQRYLGQPVSIDSAVLGMRPVSGVAATDNPRAFLQALPALLPLRVQQQADGSWRISAL
jgi:transmembrane sensor